MESFWSLVNVDRVVMISSGEMIPDFGICQRSQATRSVADKSSFPNAGNGNGMPLKSSDRRRGADPPRNESGMTGALSSFETSVRSVNSWNRFFIAADFKSESGTPKMLILHTRSCRLSAAMILVTPDRRESVMQASMTIGKAGQTSSIFFTGLLFVQRSSRCSQRGEANTTYRHSRHTCTSLCHASAW